MTARDMAAGLAFAALVMLAPALAMLLLEWAGL